MYASTDELRSSGHSLGNNVRERERERDGKSWNELFGGSLRILLVRNDQETVQLWFDDFFNREKKQSWNSLCFIHVDFQQRHYCQEEPYMIAFPHCVK